jgi:hypothetical protein
MVTSVSAASLVLIAYPFERQDDDDDWLTVIAARHRGELAEGRMLSSPLQRTATFDARVDAQAFVDILTDTGRWRAELNP